MRIRLNKRGFTLVELMIVVAIIGVLAALAIYGVRKYVLNAKTAEARSAVARITKDASSAYARPKMVGDVLAPGESVGGNFALCPDAAQVPTDVPSGEKYQSDVADWSGDPGWTCLKFTMEDPQYYAYSYTAATTASFSAVALGDLDGDGVTSTFQMDGAVVDGAVNTSPNIIETSPEE